MIASSAAWSTCVTKSFTRLERTFSEGAPSSEARLMTEPARRAARTAMVSMGCMKGAYSTVLEEHPRRPLPPQPPGQHRRRRARHEDHGHHRPAAGRARALPAQGGAMDGDACRRRARELQGP